MNKIIGLLLVCCCLFSLVGCGGSDSSSSETLKRAQEKNAIGAPLTREEKRWLDSYNSWEKEYDAQQYNEKYYK